MSQSPLPSTDFDDHSFQFAWLTSLYALKVPLPTTREAALEEMHRVIQEIEVCQQEGHRPDHHDIPWRIGYLIFCLYRVEHLGLCRAHHDHGPRSRVVGFLEASGISVPCAIELALVRLRALCCGDDIIVVDTKVLVPIMRQFLWGRP